MLPDYAQLEQAVGHDWFALDPNLAFLLDLHLPHPSDRAFAEEHVGCFGPLVGAMVAVRAEETDEHGPVLRRYDRWGREVGEIVHHPTWLANKADLVRAGFVGLPWRAGRRVPAVVSASCAYLVSQAETALYCALGMTGGAADIVGRYAPDPIRQDWLDRLTDLDPERSWEAGMFLTERQGGSDVGANTTLAAQDGDEWTLHGEKYFCSNVDADVFVVLARPEGAPAGTKGLATFLVPRRLSDGSPNGIVVTRLKPKLGTIGVPTGEVELRGSRAWLAGPGTGGEARTENEPASPSAVQRWPGTDAARDGRGINRMMEMVSASRFGVALMGLGIHRRSFLEAAIYAACRTQWNRRIDGYPLVRETLVDLAVELEAGMALTFECAAVDHGEAGADPLLRRILVPLAKARATRSALWAASTALEVHGGNGYMADWPLARQLRDAQCHTIWEGTENIICLDVRRAIRGDGADRALDGRVGRALDSAVEHPVLGPAVDLVAAARADAKEAVRHLAGVPDDLALLHSRRLMELLADLAEGALLLHEAAWSLTRDGDARKAAVAGRFVRHRLGYAPLRGILSSDRTALDLFEPITRYGRIEPDRLAETAGTQPYGG